jgi:gluconokinase
MPHIPGLRSCYAKVGRIYVFGRTLDKIRLHAAGQLPPDYTCNLGDGRIPLFDARLCRFLGVSYADLKERTLAGGSDEEILAWAHARGIPRSDEDCAHWNSFMRKLGWRDERSAILQQRIVEFGLVGKPIETFFDLNDYDEGRDPVRDRPWEPKAPLVILIMGVAGSGKTTVGVKLAKDLGWAFRDADDFHPPENVAKMAAGIPLTDADRAPWLKAIRDYIDQRLSAGESAVVTCSALKERYRQVVVGDASKVKLVHLTGDFKLLLERISGRQGHFMKPDMLQSQLDTLETPKDALTLNIAETPEALVSAIRQSLNV